LAEKLLRVREKQNRSSSTLAGRKNEKSRKFRFGAKDTLGGKNHHHRGKWKLDLSEEGELCKKSLSGAAPTEKTRQRRGKRELVLLCQRLRSTLSTSTGPNGGKKGPPREPHQKNTLSQQKEEGRPRKWGKLLVAHQRRERLRRST